MQLNGFFPPVQLYVTVAVCIALLAIYVDYINTENKLIRLMFLGLFFASLLSFTLWMLWIYHNPNVPVVIIMNLLETCIFVINMFMILIIHVIPYLLWQDFHTIQEDALAPSN